MTQVGGQQLLHGSFFPLYIIVVENTRFTSSKGCGETVAHGHCILKLALSLLANNNSTRF